MNPKSKIFSLIDGIVYLLLVAIVGTIASISILKILAPELPGVQDAQKYFEGYKQKNPVPKNCSVEGPIDTNDWREKAKVYTYIYQCEKGKSLDGRLKELEIKYLFIVCTSGGSGKKLELIPDFENMLPYDRTKKPGNSGEAIICGSKGPI